MDRGTRWAILFGHIHMFAAIPESLLPRTGTSWTVSPPVHHSILYTALPMKNFPHQAVIFGVLI